MCQSHYQGRFSLISLFVAMLMCPAYIKVTVVRASVCTQAFLTHYSLYIDLSMSIYGYLQCIGTGAASNLTCPCFFQAQTLWGALLTKPSRVHSSLQSRAPICFSHSFHGLNYPKYFLISLHFVEVRNVQYYLACLLKICWKHQQTLWNGELLNTFPMEFFIFIANTVYPLEPMGFFYLSVNLNPDFLFIRCVPQAELV